MFSAVLMSGYSQSIVLSNIHGVLEHNANLIQVGTHDSSELLTFFNVKNVSNHSISVFCKKVQVSMMDSTEIYMCWAGGCYQSTTFVSPNAAPIAGNETNFEFVGHYRWLGTSQFGFKSGESVLRWVFFVDGNANDSASVTIKYSTYPLGVEETNIPQYFLSNVYPNPADAFAGISYSFPKSSQGKIILRNLLGTTVQTQQLFSVAGRMTLNTANLSSGIYFCSLMVDGKITQTQKLIIKH